MQWWGSRHCCTPGCRGPLPPRLHFNLIQNYKLWYFMFLQRIIHFSALSVWAAFEFSTLPFNSTPACNRRCTQWGRVNVEQMSAAPSPKCLSSACANLRVCSACLSICETEKARESRRVGEGNKMKVFCMRVASCLVMLEIDYNMLLYAVPRFISPWKMTKLSCIFTSKFRICWR